MSIEKEQKGKDIGTQTAEQVGAKSNLRFFVFSFFFWILTGLIAIYNFNVIPDSQHRFVSVRALEVDFSKEKRITIGGRPGYKIKDKSIRGPKIQLPTNLIPPQIGTLIYSDNKIKLQLNDQISDENDQNFLDKCLPKIRLIGDDVFLQKKSEISHEHLTDKGILIDYAVDGNVVLKFKKLDGAKFLMDISPKYTRLKIPLYDYYSREGQAIEFNVNEKYSSEKPEFDIPLIALHFPSSKAAFAKLVFKNNKVFHKGKVLGVVGEMIRIPDSSVFFKLEKEKETGNPMFIVLIVYFLIGLFLFLVNCLGDEVGQQQIIISFDVLFFLFGSLFHISIPLCLHYCFFYPYDVDRLSYITISAISLVGYSLVIYLFSLNKRVSKRFKKPSNNTINGCVWLLGIVMATAFIVIFFFVDNERAFGFPSHVFGRLIYIFALITSYLLASKYKKNKRHYVYFLLPIAIGIGYALFSSDWGFLILTIFFAYLYILLISTKGGYSFFWLIVFFGVLLSLPKVFNSDSNVLKIGFLERFHLAYNNNPNHVHVDDQLTTTHHKFILYAAKENLEQINFNNNDLRIPNDLRTVIHTDYVLLFASIYYGGWIWILIALLIYLMCHSMASWCYYLFGSKISKRKSTWVFFIILGYVAHILYMYGALLQVFPLTGQSIPFLAISKMEPILIVFFLAIALYVMNFFTQELNQNVLNKLREKNSKQLNWVMGILFWGITALGIWNIYQLDTLCMDENIQLTYYSKEYKAKFNEILKHFSKNPKEDNWPNILKNTSIKQVKKSKHYKNEENTFLKLLSKQYWGHQKSFNADENGFTYNYVLRRHPNYKKYLSKLNYIPFESKEVAKFDNQNIQFIQIGDSLYVDNVPEITDSLSSGYFLNFKDLKANQYDGKRRVLLGNQPIIQTRLVNGKEKVVFHNAEILGILPEIRPDLLATFDGVPPTLSIDPKMQVLLYGLLTIYSKKKDLRAEASAGVILDNKTGQVKAIISYPFLPANASELDRAKLVKKMRQIDWGINEEYPSVPLSGYNIASTFKVFLSGTALLTDSTYYTSYTARCEGDNESTRSKYGVKCHHSHGKLVTMGKYITRSCNHYSSSLLRDLYAKYPKTFEQHLNEDLYINSSFDVRLSLPTQKNYMRKFEEPNIGTINPKDLRAIGQISIGGQNVRIPLLMAVNSFSRIISGNKVFPSIFDYETTFAPIPNAQKLTPLKKFLNSTAIDGTAWKLTRNDNKFFGDPSRVYAKTGTGSKRSSYLLFGTERYSYGIMFLKQQYPPESKGKVKAIDFVTSFLLPHIKSIEEFTKADYLK